MNDNDREKFLLDLKQIGIDNDIPNISSVNARFLRDLIKIHQPLRILEVGTANWFSSINFWIEAEKYGGMIDTIEFSERSFGMAQENIDHVWLSGVIYQHLWNALDILPQLDWVYDFVFIDWMKRRTKDFFELSYPLLRSGWVMIIDDVILFRNKMEDLYDLLDKKNIIYNVIPVDVNDGVIMLVK